MMVPVCDGRFVVFLCRPIPTILILRTQNFEVLNSIPEAASETKNDK